MILHRGLVGGEILVTARAVQQRGHRFRSTLEKSTKELGIEPRVGFIEALQVCFHPEGRRGVKFRPEAGQEFDIRCVGRCSRR